MCGIAGFNFKDKELIKKMVQKLNHRGPDSKGFYLDKVSLGHSRLSIIDINNGKQPMYNEDGSIVIVFNGEIYNYKELKKELEKKHRFSTESDTEVIIHGYEEWGIDVLKKLNGQFAFCLYDGKKMFLARDRLGIKPLYFYAKDNKFIFASEMKAILEYPINKEVDKSVISDYFSYNYVPAPKTILKNVYKLLPGHYLLFQDLKIKIRPYWDVEFVKKDVSLNQIYQKLKESVEKRLIADVPVGAFLSGGIDSSLIVALISQLKKEVKTFSVGFTNGNNELDIAKKTSEKFNTDHHEYMVDTSDFSLFKKLVYCADEPFADTSLIPSYFVCKMARQKVKVCLSGDGGDENFAGYQRYVKNKTEKYYSKIPIFNERFKRIREISKIKNNLTRFIKGNETFIDSEKKELLFVPINKSYKMKYNKFKDLNGLLYNDIKTTLPNSYLKKVDTASMTNSLEVRTPFLDHEFVEMCATISPNQKLFNLQKKFLLKKIAKPILPKEVLKAKKTGFSSPVDSWLRNELKDTLHKTIMNSSKRGILNKNYINKLWKQHQKKEFNHQQKLWNIICLEMWYEKFIDND